MNKILSKFSFKNMKAQQKHQILRTAVSIAIGLGLAATLILLTSDKPNESLRYFFTAPLQNWNYFGMWVQKAIPIMFTGTAVCIMFSANQFNLGLEGAFLFGGLGAAVINIYVTPGNPVLGMIVSCLGGIVIGGLVTFIPAILNKIWNASIMVTSLMMNYIALWFSTYLLFSHLKDPKTSKSTYQWSPKEIMKLTFGQGNNKFTVFYSLFIVLIVVVLAWFFLFRTKTGIKLREVGANGNFARYVGVNVALIAILAQVIGGAIAGLGGACEIMSNYTAYSWVELTGFGWDGVTIAIFAKNNPKNVPLAAFFIAYLRAGAMVMSFKTNIQTELTSVVEGVVILFLLAEKFLSKTYRKMIIAEAQQKLLEEKAVKEAN